MDDGAAARHNRDRDSVIGVTESLPFLGVSSLNSKPARAQAVPRSAAPAFFVKDQVLTAWANNEPIPSIEARLKLTKGQVLGIVHRARTRNDSRAMLRRAPA